MSRSLIPLSAALLMAALPPAPLLATPQDYVVLGTPLVNIRTGPSPDAMVVGRAQKGDIFKVVGQTEEWYRVVLFSNEPRFILKADYVHPLSTDQLLEAHGMALPASTARCRSIFWDTESGLDRAAREASEIIPRTLNLERHTVLRRVLEDRILLEMFAVHRVQPALYRELVATARREGWR